MSNKIKVQECIDLLNNKWTDRNERDRVEKVLIKIAEKLDELEKKSK